MRGVKRGRGGEAAGPGRPTLHEQGQPQRSCLASHDAGREASKLGVLQGGRGGAWTARRRRDEQQRRREQQQPSQAWQQPSAARQQSSQALQQQPRSKAAKAAKPASRSFPRLVKDPRHPQRSPNCPSTLQEPSRASSKIHTSKAASQAKQHKFPAPRRRSTPSRAPPCSCRGRGCPHRCPGWGAAPAQGAQAGRGAGRGGSDGCVGGAGGCPGWMGRSAGRPVRSERMGVSSGEARKSGLAGAQGGWLPQHPPATPAASQQPTARGSCPRLHQLAGQDLQLALAELGGVDRDAALGAAKGYVHHSLPGGVPGVAARGRGCSTKGSRVEPQGMSITACRGLGGGGSEGQGEAG